MARRRGSNQRKVFLKFQRSNTKYLVPKVPQNCPITRKRETFVCLCRQCSNDDCDVFLRALLRHFSLLLSFSDVEDSIDVDKLSTEKEVTVDGAADKNIENLNAKDETESNEEDRESSIQQQQLEEERQSNQDLSDEDEKETDKEEEELKIEYDSLERITPTEMGDNHRSSTEDSTDRLDFRFLLWDSLFHFFRWFNICQ